MTPDFGNQPRLAGARLAAQDQGCAFATTQLDQHLLERGQFLVATDQWRTNAQAPGARPAFFARACLDQVKHRDRLLDTLEGPLAKRREFEVRMSGGIYALIDENLPGLRQLLEPCSNMGRVANSRVVHAQVVADRPDHDLSGIQTHA